MKYSGECALMDPVPSEGESDPAQTAPRTTTTPSGGLGRLPKDDASHGQRQSPPRRMTQEEEEDAIPF